MLVSCTTYSQPLNMRVEGYVVKLQEASQPYPTVPRHFVLDRGIDRGIPYPSSEFRTVLAISNCEVVNAPTDISHRDAPKPYLKIPVYDSYDAI
jgi:hypothetical protein